MFVATVLYRDLLGLNADNIFDFKTRQVAAGTGSNFAGERSPYTLMQEVFALLQMAEM